MHMLHFAVYKYLRIKVPGVQYTYTIFLLLYGRTCKKSVTPGTSMALELYSTLPASSPGAACSVKSSVRGHAVVAVCDSLWRVCMLAYPKGQLYV